MSEPSYCDQSQSTTDPTSQTTPLSNSVAAAEDSLPTGNPQASNSVAKAVSAKQSRPYRAQNPSFVADSIQPFSTNSLAKHKTVTPSLESKTDPLDNPQKDTKASVSAAMQESTSAELPEKGLEAYLQQQEKQLIVTALQQTGWNKTQAAELLGTTFRSLRYRMKKLGIAEEQTDS